MADGLYIPGGPGFSGHPQPPDVPCDPTGDAWRGEPGPPGPPGPAGPPGSFGAGEAPVDGFAYGRVNAVWQKVVPITQLGYAIGQVPGPIVSQGGIAALRPPAELIFQRNAFAATDGSDFRFRRATTFTGGTPSNINKTLQVEFGNTAGNGCQEWPFLVKAMNSSTSGGQLVSAYIQAWRNAGTGLTTGLITDVADFQGTASSVSGQLTSMEWDLNATGADDMANGGRFGGIGGRQMVHAVFANMSTTINSEYTAGIWFGTGINGSASAYVDSLLCVQGGVGQPTLIRNFLDSRGAAPPPGVTDPVAAVRMSAGHIVDFNGGPALNSAPGNFLQYTTTGTPRLRYMVGGTEAWSVADSGALSASVTATGGTTARTLQDHFADVVNVKDFGAVFDGASHPLSAYYGSLAAAQAVYPHAVALTDEIDGVAIQAAINFCATRIVNFSGGGVVQLPSALGFINQPLVITKTNVSLRGGSTGFMVRANVGVPFPSAPTTLRWTGAARTPGQGPINMLTVAPLVADLRMLVGCNVSGIMWNCNFVPGVSGPLFMSMRDAIIDVACNEPNGIAYPGAVLAANSRNITVSSTVGVNLGESVVSASLPEGSQVSLIVDGTTLQLTTQATASSTETVTIGGTGIRFDVVDNLSDSNSIQLFHARFWGQALSGGVNATAPLVLIGGTDVQKAQPGNTCIAWFDLIYTVNANGVAVAINNSDHLMFENISNVWLGSGATPSLIVCNGAIDPRNGGGRFHHFRHIGGAGAIKFTGTDTAGFTRGSSGNVISFLDLQNGAAYPTVGVGSSVLVTGDNSSPALAGIGSTIGVSAHVPDSTTLAGNVRGAYAVDLQTTRAAATQVASGQNAVVGGGISNTASGTQSVVVGGSLNTASGTGSAVVSGVANAATASYAVASGTGTTADLYGLLAHSSGVVAAGRKAQYNKQILRANSAANTTPVRLTADGGAASANNVCNLPFSGQSNAMSVQLTAIDSVGNNFYSWMQPIGLLRRNGGVAQTFYTPGTPAILTSGTTAGIVITEAADTTNAGYSLTFTPPTGNTAIWRVVATVEWTRVDGA